MTAERRKQAIKLRTAGISWAQIAAELDYADPAAACKDVDRALTASLGQMTENATNLRTMELLRLDRLQAGLWTAATGGDPKAVRTLLEVMKTRIRLLGLDAAQRTLDNAVDAWLQGITGEGDPADAAAAAAITAVLADAA